MPENIVGEDRPEGLPDGYTVPNNWTSIFSTPQIDKVKELHGGMVPDDAEIPAVTAWVWNSKRQQFYLAEFMKEQPSLNWAFQTVRDEIKDVVRFWLDKGVDSFRVDVINHIGTDPEFKDEEIAERGAKIGQYNKGHTNPHDQWKQERLVSHWPELGHYVKDLISVLDEEKYKNKNIRFVFEDWMSALGSDDRMNKLSPNKGTVFKFRTLLHTNRENWNAETFWRLIHDYYEEIFALDGSVPNQVTGNHDVDALRTRLGSVAAARAAIAMLGSLPGSLYVWQGGLAGRPNIIVPPERQKDGDIGQRDGERVPLAWDDSINGGFSRADPDALWLPAVDSKIYKSDNLAVQALDPNSPYNMVKNFLRLRKYDPELRSGGLRMLHTDSNVLAFQRTDPNDPRRVLDTIVNMTPNTVEVSVFRASHALGRVAFSSSTERGYSEIVDLSGKIILPPDEALILESA